MQVISITQWSGRRVTAAVKRFSQMPRHCWLSEQVKAYSQDMNELQYIKAFQASIYEQQYMLPLQCMTAEEKDRCLFYGYPNSGTVGYNQHHVC